MKSDYPDFIWNLEAGNYNVSVTQVEVLISFSCLRHQVIIWSLLNAEFRTRNGRNLCVKEKDSTSSIDPAAFYPGIA